MAGNPKDIKNFEQNTTVKINTRTAKNNLIKPVETEVKGFIKPAKKLLPMSEEFSQLIEKSINTLASNLKEEIEKKKIAQEEILKAKQKEQGKKLAKQVALIAQEMSRLKELSALNEPTSAQKERRKQEAKQVAQKAREIKEIDAMAQEDRAGTFMVLQEKLDLYESPEYQQKMLDDYAKRLEYEKKKQKQKFKPFQDIPVMAKRLAQIIGEKLRSFPTAANVVAQEKISHIRRFLNKNKKTSQKTSKKSR